jgi:hypothetical protein
MNLSKKAEGLSLTTIIVAAIALVVLIVLLLIFSGRMGLFKSTLDSCPPDSDTVNKLDTNGLCASGKLPIKMINEKETPTSTKIVPKYCCPKT